MTNNIESLRDTVGQWLVLPDEQRKTFASIFQVKTIEKNEFLLSPGDKSYDLMFVYEAADRIA